jgi:hypothetical protein
MHEEDVSAVTSHREWDHPEWQGGEECRGVGKFISLTAQVSLGVTYNLWVWMTGIKRLYAQDVVNIGFFQ